MKTILMKDLKRAYKKEMKKEEAVDISLKAFIKQLWENKDFPVCWYLVDGKIDDKLTFDFSPKIQGIVK